MIVATAVVAVGCLADDGDVEDDELFIDWSDVSEEYGPRREGIGPRNVLLLHTSGC